MLTAEHLRSVLNYDPDTGHFRWLQTGTGRKPDKAGSVNAYGYLMICIDQKSYGAHRMAWLYMTGAWPADQIDHINNCPADNRFCNLREATDVDNSRNRKCRSDNISGLKGVCYRKDRKSRPWHARIVYEGRRRSLGFFGTPAEAHAAYAEAATEGHGSFARIA